MVGKNSVRALKKVGICQPYCPIWVLASILTASGHFRMGIGKMALSDGRSYRPMDGDSDASLRLPSLPWRLDIIERIMSESIMARHARQYRRRVQYTFFCGAEPGKSAGYDGQLEAVGRCLEWFVFDYVVPELETTPAVHWFDSYAETLNRQQRQDARDCLKFILSLYEIAEINPGKGFVAVDLLRRPLRYHVDEKVLTSELREGQLILGRLFPHRNAYVLSGMAVLMNAEVTCQIEDMISNGKLKPAAIVQNIDAVELENLFNRRVRDIEKLDTTLLRRRINRYLLDICPGYMTYEELMVLIEGASDPLSVAAEFAERLEVCGRHEMDLMFTYIITLWNRYHG